MISTYNKLIDPKKDLTDVSKQPISRDGNFGLVYKGVYHKRRHNKDTQYICAIKKLKSDCIKTEDYNTLYREVSSQNALKHVALLPLLGFYLPFCNIGKCTIVTPFMEHGSLHKLLNKEFHSQAPHEWTDTTRAINIFGIAAGMCYMHQRQMLHRDLKTDNILLDDNYYPKICDFGCSKIFEYGLNDIVTATNCGTPVYMAPELLLDQPYNSKVDVFAYAMVLYELIALQPAYEDPRNPHGFNFLNNIMNGNRPKLDKRFSEFFKKLISDCWAQNPNERPSFVEILRTMLAAYKDGSIFKDGTVETDVLDVYIQDALEPLHLDEDPAFDF